MVGFLKSEGKALEAHHNINDHTIGVSVISQPYDNSTLRDMP